MERLRTKVLLETKVWLGLPVGWTCLRTCYSHLGRIRTPVLCWMEEIEKVEGKVTNEGYSMAYWDQMTDRWIQIDIDLSGSDIVSGYWDSNSLLSIHEWNSEPHVACPKYWGEGVREARSIWEDSVHWKNDKIRFTSFKANMYVRRGTLRAKADNGRRERLIRVNISDANWRLFSWREVREWRVEKMIRLTHTWVQC